MKWWAWWLVVAGVVVLDRLVNADEVWDKLQALRRKHVTFKLTPDRQQVLANGPRDIIRSEVEPFISRHGAEIRDVLQAEEGLNLERLQAIREAVKHGYYNDFADK